MTPILNYTETLVPGSPENVADVQTMFDQARAVINALDNENFDPSGTPLDYSKVSVPTGAIALDKLPAMTAGQLIVGDGTKGVVRSPVGSATVSAGGGFSQARHFVGQSADQNLPISNSYQSVPNCAFSPGSGTWLVIGKAVIKKGDAGGVVSTELRLRDSALTVLDQTQAGATDASGNVPIVSHVVMSVYSGGNQVLLDARAAAFSGANCVVTLGKLVGIRLA